MFFRVVAVSLCAIFVCATPLFAQQNPAPPADLYAQIPAFGEAGEKKLQSGDTRGAIEEFKKAFEGSRTLTRQYPQEPAYRENAYYYLGRLASAYGTLNEIASALQMAEPGARGYVEIATADPLPENKEKAADALNRLAWFQVLSRDAGAAETTARQALALMPQSPDIEVNLAHALLLNGKREEALAIYARTRTQAVDDKRTMRDVILNDFDAMERAGIPAETIAPMRAELGGGKRQPSASWGSIIATWAFVALVFVAIAAVFGIFIYFDRKRTAALEAKVRLLGLTFRRKATPEDRQLIAGSNLTTLGRSRNIRNVIELPESDGTRMTLFDFSYVIGSGKRNRTFQQTVTRVQSSKLNLPAFDLRPESVLHKIATSLGMKDIDIEGWPSFSRMYLLRGQDEAGIRRMFTRELLQHCEAHRGLWMSGAGDQLWFHRENRRVKPDELEAFLNDVRRTFALFTASAATAPPPPPLPPPPLPTS